MICPKCGQDNPAEARFCGKCAAALTASGPPNLTSAPAEQVVAPGLKVGIIVGTVFIPLLGIIMGLIYMNDPNAQKKATGRIWLYVGIGMFALQGLCCLLGTMGGMGGGGFR
jgi:hypothetical protein